MRTWIFIALVVIGFLGIRFIYFQPKFMVGADIPSFTSELKNGNSFSTDELEGSYVLYDFWGSWCGPCRKENKNLVLLHEEFGNNPNFSIVSIAIETEEKSWEKAILQDQLDWEYHIVQTDRFKSPLAQLFGIREIPTSYMVNPKGKIAGVNMTYTEMKSFLNKQLNE